VVVANYTHYVDAFVGNYVSGKHMRENEHLAINILAILCRRRILNFPRLLTYHRVRVTFVVNARKMHDLFCFAQFVILFSVVFNVQENISAATS